jgi:hypothetical protein
MPPATGRVLSWKGFLSISDQIRHGKITTDDRLKADVTEKIRSDVGGLEIGKRKTETAAKPQHGSRNGRVGDDENKVTHVMISKKQSSLPLGCWEPKMEINKEITRTAGR